MTEDEVQRGEEIGENVQKRLLRSGDNLLIKLAHTLPKESYARLAQIFSDTHKNTDE
ncbi:hypothetical protein [Candidatus Spongiihabitans sp.]|uniref:hypothetical protein n=1 Tax=Candidatus Spongiihabitans sp. TaxID=3101308 RepID=UPI003C7D6C0E